MWEERGGLLAWLLGKKRRERTIKTTFQEKATRKRKWRIVFYFSVSLAALVAVSGVWYLHDQETHLRIGPPSNGVLATSAAVAQDGALHGSIQLDGQDERAGTQFAIDVLVKDGETLLARLALGERTMPASRSPVLEHFSFPASAALLNAKSGWRLEIDARPVGPLPIANVQAAPLVGDVPFSVDADASSSRSSVGARLQFAWFLDGKDLGLTEARAKIGVEVAGEHELRVVVSDRVGKSSQDVHITGREPERMLDVTCFVRTGREDKEGGGWRIRMTQGSNTIVDKTWGFGENWDNHQEKRFVIPVNGVLRTEPLVVTSSIEERPGEVRIDWGIDEMRIVLRTTAREIVFDRRNFMHKSRGDGGALKNLDIPRM